jgi:hypothetical protein
LRVEREGECRKTLEIFLEKFIVRIKGGIGSDSCSRRYLVLAVLRSPILLPVVVVLVLIVVATAAAAVDIIA